MLKTYTIRLKNDFKPLKVLASDKKNAQNIARTIIKTGANNKRVEVK